MVRAYQAKSHFFTDLQVAASVVQTSELCQKCGQCQQLCPVQALSQQEESMDYKACQDYEGNLKQAFCDPCSNCIKVCPVGEDRILFKSLDSEKYPQPGKNGIGTGPTASGVSKLGASAQLWQLFSKVNNCFDRECRFDDLQDARPYAMMTLKSSA